VGGATSSASAAAIAGGAGGRRRRRNGECKLGFGGKGGRLGPLNPTVERDDRPIRDGRLRLIHGDRKKRLELQKESFPLPGFEPGSPG
jgi:hypothetical protein